MNSNDFYKSKYSKYKNKYLELKQKNLKINQEGGISLQKGTYLFYIPVNLMSRVYNLTNIETDSNGNDYLQTTKKIRSGDVKETFYLTENQLYDNSVLIIPIDEKDNILSTENWFIPMKTEKKGIEIESIDDVNKSTTNNTNYKTYFEKAKFFLEKHNIKKEYKLPSYTEINVFDAKTGVYCFKYKINSVRSPTLLKSIKFEILSWIITPEIGTTHQNFEDLGEKLGRYIFYIPTTTTITKELQKYKYKELLKMSLLVIPYCTSTGIVKVCQGQPNPIIPSSILNTDKWIINNKVCNLKIIKSKELNAPEKLTHEELFCAAKDCFNDDYNGTEVRWYDILINTTSNELKGQSIESFSFNSLKTYFNKMDNLLQQIKKVNIPNWFFY
jgi:hypothetical protein